MKYILIYILFLLNLQAEMSPLVYEKARNEAQEFINIKIVDIHTKKKSDTLHVNAKAKIIKIHRTNSNLKIGDIINILYDIEIHKDMDWVGPSSNILLQKYKKYSAYLKKIDKNTYTTDAFGKSFDKIYLIYEKIPLLPF